MNPNTIARAVWSTFGRMTQRNTLYDTTAYDLAGGKSRHIGVAVVGVWAKASGR